MVNKKTVGILGGGQLGRMMVEAASRMNIPVAILDEAGCPASQVLGTTGTHIPGSFRSLDKIRELAKHCDVITTEIEHVDVDALEAVEQETGVTVHPSVETIRVVQDKYLQKMHVVNALEKKKKDLLEKIYLGSGNQTDSAVSHEKSLLDNLLDIHIGEFMNVEAGNEIQSIEKAGELYGYPLMLKTRKLAYDGRGNKTIRSKSEIDAALKELKGDLYVEKWVEFEKEVAVMVAKDVHGDVVSYPCVETVQKAHVCHVVVAPAQVDGAVRDRAQRVAELVVKECFGGAGIYGVEMFLTKEGKLFYNEIAPRPHNSGHYSIEGCDLSQFAMHVRCVVGLRVVSVSMVADVAVMMNLLGGDDHASTVERAIECGLSVYLYGKTLRNGRKMGHVTAVGRSLRDVAKRFASAGLDVPHASAPAVGIIMGSDSDLGVMKAAAQILDEYGVSYEIRVVSAHRTPEWMVQYAKSASARGLKVLIAGAGGAAHLPGMVASLTTLPVIGVPVGLKVLGGMDSLASIVMMPRGVPVATVGIDNATNAGLLAVRILSVSDNALAKTIAEKKIETTLTVMQKDKRLFEGGFKEYN